MPSLVHDPSDMTEHSGLPKEPNNWAKTPAVVGGGKVTHTKGAIAQFYVPEVLGSSPRVEQDHETARSLYSAMRVCCDLSRSNCRLRSLMTLKSLRPRTNPLAHPTTLSSNKTRRIHSTVSRSGYGPGRTTRGRRPSPN